jgi:hypothetical protein
MDQKELRGPRSDEHFSVDRTQNNSSFLAGYFGGDVTTFAPQQGAGRLGRISRNVFSTQIGDPPKVSSTEQVRSR